MGLAVRKCFTKALKMEFIIQNRLKAPQTILCEYEKHIAVGEIEMGAAIALTNVTFGRMAQYP
jgi:hypothetical protein